MRSNEINKLWAHWIERQSNDEPPLLFIKSKAGDARVRDPLAKTRRVHGEPWSDDDSGDDAESAADVKGKGKAKDNSPGLSQARISPEPSAPAGDEPAGTVAKGGPHPTSPSASSITPQSRLSYMKSICQWKEYHQLVDSLPGKKRHAGPLPSWASWTYDQKYLPEDVHQTPPLETAHRLLPLAFKGNDAAVLGIALLIREIARGLEIEEDNPGDAPMSLISSTFSIADIEAIVGLISQGPDSTRKTKTKLPPPPQVVVAGPSRTKPLQAAPPAEDDVPRPYVLSFFVLINSDKPPPSTKKPRPSPASSTDDGGDEPAGGYRRSARAPKPRQRSH